MNILNLGIMAHVDAGKTSLTERLLYTTGVINTIGSVDAGSTQTDSMALERQRGITIKAAVVSFAINDLTVNLIDTPGHPDFIAEVERALSVLDGAVLVISAVEGVQARTRVLMRVLQRLRIPTIIFINKIDRRGADIEHVLQQIAKKLTPAIIPMGTAGDLGERSADFRPFDAADADFRMGLLDLLSEHNDALLNAYLSDETSISYQQLRKELAAQTSKALVYPVFFGSAITGAGVDPLIAGITELLPVSQGDPDAPVSGTVFKIERGPAGEKIAYVRMFSGTVHARDRLDFGHDCEGRITAISAFGGGLAVRSGSVGAGQIGKLWGLNEIQIGDTIGMANTERAHTFFDPPTLETLIVPRRPAERRTLHAALAQLTEQDPLINLRLDPIRQELFVSLYGEVQKEVIQETLRNDFQIEVEFLETTTMCIERLVGSGAAYEIMGKPSNPFIGTVGLRIEPGPVNSGVQFRLEVELGSIPLSFHKAVEETAKQTLRQGLYGWEVLDCVITMTHSGYSSVASTAGDFRYLTPLVVMDALKLAGTRVYEPLLHYQLEIPADTLGAILPVLIRLRATPDIPAMRGTSYTLEGYIPAARLQELQLQLSGLTHGEGVLEYAFDHYEPIQGEPPMRARTDHNPLNRKEYLLHVVRRV